VSYVTHLESALDGTCLAARTLQTLHRGRPLWVRYDLAQVAQAVRREDLAKRTHSMWRYRELLPVEDDAHIVSLGEAMSPLLPVPRLAAALGLEQLWIKDESQLPTGSFKARGLAMAISLAGELGVQEVAIPTAGNAGGALAAYAARAGLRAHVFMPEDTPIVNQREAALYGARVYLVNGLIHECAALVQQGKERFGWFDLSTLKEPYRIEGKKTMGLELAEQRNWQLPDAIFYPTGGGTGLIGMWKAFAELAELGWLESAKRPRMFSCQSSGCSPIATAFEAGERFADPVENARTQASGLRVPKAVGDFMILDAVRESGGQARAADDDVIRHWMKKAASSEGIPLCPETAICLAVLSDCISDGSIARTDSVVVFNTGAAQKYVECLEVDLPRLDRAKIDWTQLA
jgi:threonine synthase